MSDRRLTSAQTQRYNSITSKTGNTVVALHDAQKVEVTNAAMARMKPGTWLSDEPINAYMAMLQDRDHSWTRRGIADRPRTLFLSTFFVEKLMEGNVYDYEKVRRWTSERRFRRVGIDHIKSIADVDKIVFPINLGNSHWVLAVANVRNRRVEWYDSMGGVQRRYTNAIKRWVKQDFKDKHPDSPLGRFDTANWGELINPPGTPRQSDGYNCGVFTATAASYVGADKPFNYSSEHGDYLRKRMALEVIDMRLWILR
jgi:sentrin-specific protease 1